MSEEIENKINELMTLWADEHLQGKPIAYAWALSSGIKQEIEKATKAVKEIN